MHIRMQCNLNGLAKQHGHIHHMGPEQSILRRARILWRHGTGDVASLEGCQLCSTYLARRFGHAQVMAIVVARCLRVRPSGRYAPLTGRSNRRAPKTPDLPGGGKGLAPNERRICVCSARSTSTVPSLQVLRLVTGHEGTMQAAMQHSHELW